MERTTASKVYFDGSHFIGIPASSKESQVRTRYPGRVITVYEYIEESIYRGINFLDFFTSPASSDFDSPASFTYNDYFKCEAKFEYDKKVITLKRKVEITSYFNELYNESIDLKKKDQRAYIISKLSGYFDNNIHLVRFVDDNFTRLKRNLITRKVRLMRKALLQEWTYFATFTYDSSKLKEEDFKRKLKTCLSHLSSRNSWKYLGVFEKSPTKNRLHFHSLVYVPPGKMIGELKLVRDYSTQKNRMQETVQNSFFNDRFGRSDFQPITKTSDISSEISYMCKYLTKTNDKIIYSKGLPEFYGAILEPEDVICPYGVDDRKYVLFDDISSKLIKTRF